MVVMVMVVIVRMLVILGTVFVVVMMFARL